MKYYRLQYIFLLGILLYFFLENIWGVRFTTSDDSSHVLWANHDLKSQFNIIDNIAKSQGRLYFYYHVWYLIFIQTFWNSITYDLIQTGSLLVSIVLITYTLILYSNNKHYFLYPLVYISITPIIWDHTLTTSVPLYHYIYLIKLSLIFILVFKYKGNPTKIKLYSIYLIFSLSIIGQEYQLFVSYFSLIIALYLIKDKSFNKRIIYPISVISLCYLILVFIFYSTYKSSYDGAVIDYSKFSYVHFLGLILEWSLSGNIFFEIFRNYELLSDINYNQYFTDGIDVFSQISIEAESYLFIVVIYFLVKTVDLYTSPKFILSKQKTALYLYFVLIITLPQVFLALTPKYQFWYSIGVDSYTYTSLSNFAICIVLNNIISILLNSYNFIFKTILFLVFSITFLINNAFSSITSGAMKENTEKWNALDMFMSSPYASSQNNIRAPRFAHRFWYTPNFEPYWNSLIPTLYKKNITIYIESNNLSANADHYIDYFNHNNTIIVLYGKLLNNQYLEDPLLISKSNNTLKFEYINNNNVIRNISAKLTSIPNNLYEYKFDDIVKLNTIRFSNNYLDGYVYTINNLVNINEKILFNKTRDNRHLLGKKWSKTEGDSVWGYGAESQIYFSINRVNDCSPSLELSINPIQSKADSTIELVLNGESIKKFMPTSSKKSYYFELDNSIFDKHNTLILKNNFFASPKNLNINSNDKRPLSIRLYYFKLFCI